MLDLDDLLHSFAVDAPSGPDLEYAPEFIALMLASQVGEEKVVGDSVIAAEEPDYNAVTQSAIALLGTTKDLRIAVILATAALKTEGLPAFAQVLSYIRSCLDDHWDSIHPQLDEDDDNDPTMRVNAVRGLLDRTTTLGALRLAPLTNSRGFGQFCLRDLQMAEGEIGSADAGPTLQTITAAFHDTDPGHLATMLAAVDAARDNAKAIAAGLDDRVGSLAPDLAPLQDMLHDIRRRLFAHAAHEDTGDIQQLTEEQFGVAPIRPVADAAARSTPPGAISSPEDVKTAIDRITDYYARFEPSSPIPLLLNRARRLVSADFVTIMKDMAPQGVENVAFISGIKESDD